MAKPNDSTNEGNATSRSASKVAKLIDQYDLVGLGKDLEERWTREEDRMSLRALAEYFNTELLAAVLARNTTNVLDGEAVNYYELLTDDDVSSGARVKAENKLKQSGINVEQLRSEFVSRQAIHTYLTKERNTSYTHDNQTDEERVSARISTIRRIKNRLVVVSEKILSELIRSDYVSDGPTRVTVLVQVTCERCGIQYPIAEFISNGGCDCEEEQK